MQEWKNHRVAEAGIGIEAGRTEGTWWRMAWGFSEVMAQTIFAPFSPLPLWTPKQGQKMVSRASFLLWIEESPRAS